MVRLRSAPAPLKPGLHPVPKKLPAKLAKEPLVEAVCELKVDSEVELHTVVPGLLYASLGEITAIEQMPASNVPANIRASLPGLMDAPLVRMHWNEYSILCGRSSVAVASRLPYEGWNTFKLHICNIFKTMLNKTPVRSIQRYSVKYINLIEGDDLGQQHEALDWNLTVGEHPVVTGPVQLRCEIAGTDGMITVLQIVTGSIVQLMNTPEVKHGCLVDTDTVMQYQTSDIQGFKEQLEDRLEAVKLENKKWMFESLKQSTIDQMGPTYDE